MFGEVYSTAREGGFNQIEDVVKGDFVNGFLDLTSPNSFTITATRWLCSEVNIRFSRVVFPAPRKPVRIVTGVRVCNGSPIKLDSTGKGVVG